MSVSSKSFPSVTVIIPTRNGAETLRELLAMLRQQTIELNDIHVVDSDSSDDTLDVARQFEAKITSIKASDFDHGGTRSESAAATEGDVVLFFTQDALPATRDCVEKLLHPFSEDEQVAVCYGRQLPGFDADYNARRLRHFNYPAESSVRSFDDRNTYGLKTVFTSNSFAAYRRKDLDQIEYFRKKLIFGEDMDATARLLQAGKKVAYVAEARVYHSHNYTFSEEFKRSFDNGVYHAVEPWLVETYGGATSIGKKYVIDQLKDLLRKGEYSQFLDSFVRNGCKFIGYAFGRRYTKLPRKVIEICTMNSRYWQS